MSYDPDTGLPRLAGTALKRLAAAGCATVLHALAHHLPPDDTHWPPLVNAAPVLFGEPGSTRETDGLARFDAAAYPEVVQGLVRAGIRGRFMDPHRVLRATTTRRFRTATDDATGAALEGSLRVVRVALVGTVLDARIRSPRTLAELDRALLAASLCAGLRRAGLHRSRGSGRLQPSLLDADGNDITGESLDALEKFVTSPYVPPETETKQRGAPPNLNPATDDIAHVVPLTITLEQPLLTARLGAEPNSVVGEDHLRGSVLRGRAVEAFIDAHELGEGADLPAIQRANELFFRPDRVRYLPAYPLVTTGRLLPTPRSLASSKGDEQRAFDFSLITPANATREVAEAARLASRGTDDRDTEDPAAVAWKPVRVPFVSLGPDLATDSPTRRAREHIRIDPAFGRPRDGGLFLYDALAPGQTFRAYIWCASRSLADEVRTLLSGHTDLGRARSSDYGKVSTEAGEPEPAEEWHEVPPVDPSPDTLSVWFLSDTLVRDAGGTCRADAETVTQALAQELRCPLSLRRERGAFLAAGPVAGYNGTWGHHLPQQQAVLQGSVLVFDRPRVEDGEPLEDRLRALERDGLGLRREEGFGRLTFDRLITPSFATHPAGRAVQEPVQPVPPPATDNEERDLERIARALLDETLAPKLHKRVREVAPGFQRCSRSLLGRLRKAFLDAEYRLPEDGRKRLEELLNSLAAPARDALTSDKARVGDSTLLDWLRARAKGTNTWNEVSLYEDHLPSFGTYRIWETVNDLPDALRYRTDVRLAHDVLARAARAAQRDENEATPVPASA